MGPGAAGWDLQSTPWMTVVGNEIRQVEERLSDLVFSRVPAVFQISEHLLSAGGKRLRPALVALAAKATGNPYETERVVNVGAATELIHMATLVHDDVIDQTGVRRGRATANSFWGNKISVLSGDHMLSKAFLLLSSDADPDLLRAFASMTVAMSESEVLQAVCERDLEGWKQHYLEIIQGKTAGFFAACCRSGAIIAGAAPEIGEALEKYGMNLGIAFQITDDLLDIAGSPSTTGKPLGTDIREGKFTLPVLLTLENVSPETRLRLLEILGKDEPSNEDILEVCEAARSSGAIDMATSTAASYASVAAAVLESLPSGRVRKALESLAQGVIGRSR